MRHSVKYVPITFNEIKGSLTPELGRQSADCRVARGVPSLPSYNAKKVTNHVASNASRASIDNTRLYHLSSTIYSHYVRLKYLTEVRLYAATLLLCAQP